jgi:DHA2 family multidrug resistance protein-like MFS transporter
VVHQADELHLRGPQPAPRAAERFDRPALGAAYSQTAGQLIAARAVEGIAGATLMPSTLALIRNMFHDEKQRRTAIATVA